MRLYLWPGIVVLLSLTPPVSFAERSQGPEPFASDPAVRAFSAELLRLAGGGFLATERAAFLVAADEGRYRCHLWPYQPGFQRAVFRGRIPPRTVAVMHTHPNSVPHPSTTDRREARRLGIPFLVISARHVYVISRSGEVTAIVDNEWWSDGVDRPPADGCALIG